MMAEGKARDTWGHTANLILWLSEVWRASGNFKTPPKQLKWADCYPFAEKEKPMPVPISALRDVFMRHKKKKPK